MDYLSGRQFKECLGHNHDLVCSPFSIPNHYYSIIFITSISTPWSMAFQADGVNIGMTVFDSAVNIMFLCDIILQFFTAFYDGDYNIVDSRKVRNIS